MTPPASTQRGSGVIIVVTAMMLFSMFFGAGNLIFPPQLAAEAGSSFWPAIVGFLLTGVALPVLGIVAIGITGTNLRDLAGRAGAVFGVVFSIVAYLSIGAFYALPRTAAVTWELGIEPHIQAEGIGPRALFAFLFFGVSLALAWNPNSIVDKLGKVLTPALIFFLIVIVVVAVSSFPISHSEPSEKYATHPLTGGLLEGYLTMDSIASLAFGIVVITSLRYKGVRQGPRLVRGVVISGVLAGVMLAAIYLGLGFIGRVTPDAASYDSGAGLLSAASKLTLGDAGLVIFGLVVALACLTTSIGLIAATGEFFHELLPGIPYKAWAIIFAVMSFAMASLGLKTVLSIAAPVIGFVYPPAITLILLTVAEYLLLKNRRMRLGLVFAIWASVVWSLLSTTASLISAAGSLTAWMPFESLGLGWVIPTLLALIMGLALDKKNGQFDITHSPTWLAEEHAPASSAPSESK